MRFKTVTSAVAISAALALAACGQDQTAEAPPADQQGQVAQTQPAPPPPGADAPPATAGAPATETEGQVTVVEPAQPAPQQDQMAQTAPGAAPGAPGTADQTGALPSDVGEEIQPGRYQSGDLALELTPDGSFMMMGADGQQVTGQYNLFGDTLTLTNVQNAPPNAPFPMTCTVEPEGEGFRVIADAQSCAMLDGQVFQPAG